MFVDSDLVPPHGVPPSLCANASILANITFDIPFVFDLRFTFHKATTTIAKIAMPPKILFFLSIKFIPWKFYFFIAYSHKPKCLWGERYPIFIRLRTFFIGCILLTTGTLFVLMKSIQNYCTFFLLIYYLVIPIGVNHFPHCIIYFI